MLAVLAEYQIDQPVSVSVWMWMSFHLFLFLNQFLSVESAVGDERGGRVGRQPREWPPSADHVECYAKQSAEVAEQLQLPEEFVPMQMLHAVDRQRIHAPGRAHAAVPVANHANEHSPAAHPDSTAACNHPLHLSTLAAIDFPPFSPLIAPEHDEAADATLPAHRSQEYEQ